VLAWAPCAARAARDIARRRPVDLVYTSAGPFSSVLLGARLKRSLGVPWVVDYRDPWTDDGMGIWPTKVHHRWECRQERRALEVADAVVVVTPGMRELLLRRYPHLTGRVHLIPNGFDSADFVDVNPNPPQGMLRISYTGAAVDHDFRPEVVRVGRLASAWLHWFGYQPDRYDLATYSPLYLFRAVREALNRQPAMAGQLELCFAGVFGPRNRELVRSLGLEGIVQEMGYLPHRESIRLLMSSDLLFLPLPSPPEGQRSYHYSGKLFEYLASGRPVLGAIPPGDARDLIVQSRGGWCVDPRDTHAFAQLLCDLVHRKLAGCLQIDADRAVIDQFERRTLTGRLAALFDAVTDGVYSSPRCTP
jgi:glycosyltransferase involved in cell wall biosynthesis